MGLPGHVSVWGQLLTLTFLHSLTQRSPISKKPTGTISKEKRAGCLYKDKSSWGVSWDVDGRQCLLVGRGRQATPGLSRTSQLPEIFR
jgi:hypothetical protein